MTTDSESLKKLFDPIDSQEWPGQSLNDNSILLDEWLSTPMTEAKITTAAPIIATTITIEAIQNLLYSSGYPVDEAKKDIEMGGPFEDTQFDVVVDVETSSVGKEEPPKEKASDFSEDSLPDCADLSDLSEEDLTILTDIVMSDSDFELSCDSGIEAEMDSSQESNEGCAKCELRGNKNSSKNKCDKSRNPADNPKSQIKKNNNKNKEDEERNDKKDIPKANCQFLWEFLHHLLVSEKYESCIAWKTPQKGVFRMVDHNRVAKLWGEHKNRKNMTYDKLSRALRYYYSKNILAKVNGQRLTYKFCRTPTGRKYPS